MLLQRVWWKLNTTYRNRQKIGVSGIRAVKTGRKTGNEN